jgi:hypothetical protein
MEFSKDQRILKGISPLRALWFGQMEYLSEPQNEYGLAGDKGQEQQFLDQAADAAGVEPSGKIGLIKKPQKKRRLTMEFGIKRLKSIAEEMTKIIWQELEERESYTERDIRILK